MPGFKDCQARQFDRARSDCTAAFIPETSLQDIEDCIRALHQRYTEEECVTTICPPEVVTGQTYPWKSFSAATKALQQDTNRAILDARAAGGGYGLCEITEDGKLGPITCNAVNQISPGSLPNTCNQHRAEWEGTPQGLCGPQGAIDCPEGQIRVGDKCATPAPPIVEPPPSPPPAAAAAGGIGAGGLALLAAAALAGIYAFTQVS